ncbi:MAG: hypothetical protein ABJE10_18810 [bacterium]
MMHIESDPTARPAVVVLATDDLILCCDLIAHPPSEAEDVAVLIAEKIGELVRDGSAVPSALRVRHKTLADALREPLKALSISRVTDALALPMLDEFVDGARKQVSGIGRSTGAISQPAMWAGWNFPPETLSAVLDAAAAFHAAQPWLTFTDSDIISVESRSGSLWYACVLGNAGQTFGLALYESIEDLAELLKGQTDVETFAHHKGAVVSISFDARNDLAPAMRKELTKTGRYPVGSRAYPSMWTLNTIGGGLSAAYTRDLVNALESVPRFAEWADALKRGPVVEREVIWKDERTGNVLSLMDVSIGPPLLWAAPDRLTTSLPEGDEADPRAMYDLDSADPVMTEDEARVARFLEAERAVGAPASRINGDAMVLELFVSMVHNQCGIHLRAFTEHDLRTFLYDLFPRKVAYSADLARGLRASLRRFFTWLEANERLSYPWARAVLRDRQSFNERIRRFPGGHWWDAEVGAWMAELYDDLADRAMEHSPDFAGVGEWGSSMGLDEARLNTQLSREWMIWRDEFIRAGHTHWDELIELLESRQKEWELAPQNELGGKSPSAVVKRERKRRPVV